MASRHTYSWQVKFGAVAVLVCARLAMLFGQQNEPISPVTLLVGTAARHAAGFLPAFVPAVWPVLQGYVLSLHWSSFCSVHLLASCWPLLRWVAGAV
jgi:hypothetical protein